MLYEIVKQPCCLPLAPRFQSPEKCTRKRLQVLAPVTCLELEKRFPDRRMYALLVQHARDMRRPSRQFHLATIETLGVIGRPFRFSCLHIDTPVLRQRLPHRVINTG